MELLGSERSIPVKSSSLPSTTFQNLTLTFTAPFLSILPVRSIKYLIPPISTSNEARQLIFWSFMMLLALKSRSHLSKMHHEKAEKTLDFPDALVAKRPTTSFILVKSITLSSPKENRLSHLKQIGFHLMFLSISSVFISEFVSSFIFIISSIIPTSIILSLFLINSLISFI